MGQPHQHQSQNQNQLLKAKNQNQFQSQNHFQISKWISQKLLPSETPRTPPLSSSETLKEPTLVNTKSLSKSAGPNQRTAVTAISLVTLLKRETRDLDQNLNGTSFTTRSDTNNATLMNSSSATNTNSESRPSTKSVFPKVLPPRNSLIFQRKPPPTSNQSTQR